MTEVFGVILAGGGGTRLGGVRKAELRIGGRRLIDRAADIFRGRVSELTVSTPAEFASYCPTGVVQIPDARAERQGPLAGLRAAAQYFSGRATPEAVLIFLAVDTPFAPADYVDRLLVAVSERDAAVSTWDGAPYPTDSAFRLSALLSGIDSVPETAGPKAILRMLGATEVEWSSCYREDPLANLNTLSDLIALQRRALRASPASLRQDR